MSKSSFQKYFEGRADIYVFTPGRVNLIGEHTDYNGGMVLPTALQRGVTLDMKARDDGLVRIASDSFKGLAERRIGDPARDHWSDYILGALAIAVANGFGPNGADIFVTTDLPVGAGLSSSAAVTIAVLDAARTYSDKPLSDGDMAVMAQQVENDFIGVPCGIMDQMAVAIARPGQALALDTRSLDYELIDLPETHHMAVIHSGVFRQLSEGRYAERKAECDAVKAALGQDTICRMTDKEFAALSHLPDPLPRRARHCMSEHRRTVLAAEALRNRRMTEFGTLMNESHASMRDDFEITVPAIDALVADAQAFGATGARMTGGGFGGCIVACVETGRLDGWRDRILAAHPDAFEVC